MASVTQDSPSYAHGHTRNITSLRDSRKSSGVMRAPPLCLYICYAARTSGLGNSGRWRTLTQMTSLRRDSVKSRKLSVRITYTRYRRSPLGRLSGKPRSRRTTTPPWTRVSASQNVTRLNLRMSGSPSLPLSWNLGWPSRTRSQPR